MKKQIIINVFAFFIMMICSCATTNKGVDSLSLDEVIEQSVVEMTEKLPKGTRVAIVAFSSEHENLSNYIMDELTGVLVDRGIEVADRRNLEYVYKELNFQMSGDVSDETAQTIGKFLGAQYVIIGQFMKAGVSYRYRISGINVETAVQESSSRLNVRDDRSLQNLLADVKHSQMITVAADYGKNPRTAGTFLDRGIFFISQGKYDLAIADFMEAIKLNPNLAAVYFYLGLAYSDKKDYDQEITSYNNAIRLDPYHAGTYYNRGIAYKAKGDIDKAIADYSQAIRLEPNFINAYINRGVAYKDKGDLDKSILDLNQAIQYDPNPATLASAYFNRGVAYAAKGDYDRAIADYTYTLKIDPNDAYTYNNRGGAYYNKGDYKLAIADYEAALRINPSYSMARANLEKARQMTGSGTSGSGAGSQSQQETAMTFLNRGLGRSNPDMAIADYTQAIRLEPKLVAAYHNRGIAYANKGDYEKAIIDYNQAIQLDPNNATAYTNRGNAYHMVGDRRRARADWSKALQLDPNNSIAQDNLRKF